MAVESLQDAQRTWEQTILAASLKKAPERAEHFETSSGIEVERLYTPDGRVSPDKLAAGCRIFGPTPTPA